MFFFEGTRDNETKLTTYIDHHDRVRFKGPHIVANKHQSNVRVEDNSAGITCLSHVEEPVLGTYIKHTFKIDQVLRGWPEFSCFVQNIFS